jgi:hypothetical protein
MSRREGNVTTKQARTFYWISRIEQEALGAIGMPFGSTLMVYCAKQDNAAARSTKRASRVQRDAQIAALYYFAGWVTGCPEEKKSRFRKKRW